jgi:hypothetical protein
MPIRRARRPSESALPRLPTQREQQTELERMRTAHFNSNLKLELLRTQNGVLKDQLEEATTRIEELEPLLDQNFDLQNENDKLSSKMQDMEDEIIRLEDQNREILLIQDDAVQNMEKLQAAMEESVEFIYKFEKEKAEMKAEIFQLKQGLAHSQSTSEGYVTPFDGQAAGVRPSRIHSIDEMRPASSHFDSDYYSQPGSPQVRIQTSQEGLSFAERAKRIEYMSLASKKSMHDLKKRVSNISLRNPQRALSPSLDMPQIPEADTPAHYTLQLPPQSSSASSKQTAKVRVAPEESITKLPSSTSRPGGVHARAPTNAVSSESPRSVYENRSSVDRSVPRQISIHTNTATPTSLRAPEHKSRPEHVTRTRTRQPSIDIPIMPPQRQSSRFAQTSSSDTLHQTPHPSTPAHHHHTLGNKSSSEYSIHSSPPALPSPPALSVDASDAVTTSPITTPRLPDTEKWWRDTQRVASSSACGSGVNSISANPPVSGVYSSGTRRREREPRVGETNFLFNAAEDEDAFMRRTRSFGADKK